MVVQNNLFTASFQIQLLFSNMSAEFKMCTCAVCLTNKGIRSKCLTSIAPSVCEKIQE